MDANVPVVEKLLGEKLDIEREFGGSIFGRGKMARPMILVERTGTIKLCKNTEDDFAWFVETIRKLTKVLGNRISRMTTDSPS